MSLGKFSNRKNSEPTFQALENKRMAAKTKPKVKQVYKQETNTFEEKPVVKKEEKMLEVLKAEPKKKTLADVSEEEFNTNMKKLHDSLAELQSTMEKNIEHAETEEDYEFVESVESYPTGGGEEVEIIRFRHTDVVIIVSNDKIIVHNCEQDYIDGTDKDALALIEIEESEKIPLEEIKEKTKGTETKGTETKGAQTASKTSTETATETSTEAYTQGNVTVTGGAGKGETNVTIQGQKEKPISKNGTSKVGTK